MPTLLSHLLLRKSSSDLIFPLTPGFSRQGLGGELWPEGTFVPRSQSRITKFYIYVQGSGATLLQHRLLAKLQPMAGSETRVGEALGTGEKKRGL